MLLRVIMRVEDQVVQVLRKVPEGSTDLGLDTTGSTPSEAEQFMALFRMSSSTD